MRKTCTVVTGGADITDPFTKNRNGEGRFMYEVFGDDGMKVLEVSGELRRGVDPRVDKLVK